MPTIQEKNVLNNLTEIQNNLYVLSEGENASPWDPRIFQALHRLRDALTKLPYRPPVRLSKAAVQRLRRLLTELEAARGRHAVHSWKITETIAYRMALIYDVAAMLGTPRAQLAHTHRHG